MGAEQAGAAGQIEKVELFIWVQCQDSLRYLLRKLVAKTLHQLLVEDMCGTVEYLAAEFGRLVRRSLAIGSSVVVSVGGIVGIQGQQGGRHCGSFL